MNRITDIHVSEQKKQQNPNKIRCLQRSNFQSPNSHLIQSAFIGDNKHFTF